MGHAQNCITGTHTLPVSKLGGWKHTTAFHKLSKTNRHQALKHLRQYWWCYGYWLLIGNREGRWTFRNWGDRLTHKSTTLTKERKQWRILAEHRRLESGPPLMRGMNIHKNIPVSVTKLMLGHRVGFICFHMTTDKLFPINPRAITGPPKIRFLLEAKSMPALIINPMSIPVIHTDELGCYIT